ncbi:hypothetical protein FSW04_01975 [Baekduia soli]|uniref:Peptidylamidoglycolate lyase n=1 Tax=Baekduia soli TaxID=496014 RepID=A0A5B8U0F7_9ACTN|nr:peptidyl-alpha-hydroxyglycine alpha-amidating lyase family protein [Baekduia soli]QEC46467.1 hypothetical protein FSW04_01975 [Baekduia soli]
MSSGGYVAIEGWEQLPGGWAHPDVPGVAVDAEDRVYVFARGEHPVIVYERDGTFAGSWGEGVFDNPHAIRIDHEGFVWCVDNGDHTVRKFTGAGELVLTLGEPGRASETGARTSGADYGEFHYRQVAHGSAPFHGPTDVCVLTDGSVFVADGYGNARVHRFSADGTLEASWGEPGRGPGQFHIPHGLAASPDERRLFVADRENDRIQVFDLDGGLLDQWAGVSRPDGLALSPDGLLCVTELGGRAGRWPDMDPVTDATPHSVCTLLDAGTGAVVERFGTDEPCAPGSFWAAHGVAFDSAGDLYVGEVTWSAGARNGDVPADCHTLQKLTRGV